MSSEQLAACPFCGGDKLARGMTTAADLCFWSVECTTCGVEVADDESQEAADRHWNTRVTAPTRDGEVGRLREALEAIRDGDVPRPIVQVWRADGLPSKLDRCVHNLFMNEDCSNCTADFISAALATQAEGGQ